jgi:hypothetical protein
MCMVPSSKLHYEYVQAMLFRGVHFHVSRLHSHFDSFIITYA